MNMHGKKEMVSATDQLSRHADIEACGNWQLSKRDLDHARVGDDEVA
jgi:hypothetical protein